MIVQNPFLPEVRQLPGQGAAVGPQEIGHAGPVEGDGKRVPLGRGVLGQEGDEFFPQRAPGEDLDALIQGEGAGGQSRHKPVGQHLIPLLEGEEYKRAKGHPQPPLDQWYNRKTIDLTCQREMDALLYSPGLVEELLDAFEELLPYYHYFTALCSRGE